MPMITAVVDIFNNDLSRAVLAVLMIAGTLLLLLTDRPVPDFLIALDGLAAGFYFGAVVGRMAR